MIAAIALLVFATNHGGSDLFFFVNAFSSSAAALSCRRSAALLLPRTTTTSIKLFPSSPADTIATTDDNINSNGNNDETTRFEIRVCQGSDCMMDGAEQATKMIKSLVAEDDDGNVKVKGVRKIKKKKIVNVGF